MVWRPGDPWPGTPGGASRPAWGGYVRIYVRAGIAAGNAFHLGAHTFDRLDDGNVLSGGASARAGAVDRLWVDVSCDVLDLESAGGASSSEGVFTKPDAATVVVNLYDPNRVYDPLNGDSVWAIGGHSRLAPGIPVEVFAEVVDDTATITQHYLFTGTADSWGEDWTGTPGERVAVLVATGPTKWFVNMNRPEQAPIGAGDTTAQRVARIVAESGWTGTIEAGASSVTLQATTLAQSGWEMLNRTLDDELGFVYFTATGALRWIGRDAWTATDTPPVIELGCGTAGVHDVVTDASPSAIDLQIRNAVYAARTGGVQQAVTAPASIAQFGRYDYERTDLGLETDLQAAEWAQFVLEHYAYPQISLKDVTFRPAIEDPSWEVWREALAVRFVSDLVRVYWQPADQPDATPIDAISRVVGFAHAITADAWEIRWQLIDTRALLYAGSTFTLGPDNNDRLDAGYVLA